MESGGKNHKAGQDSASVALHKKCRSRSSLCNLCVLCDSVVDEFRVKPHHRDTEDTEVAQRNLRTRTFCAKPSDRLCLKNPKSFLARVSTGSGSDLVSDQHS